MSVSLLRLELLWTESAVNIDQVYAGAFMGAASHSFADNPQSFTA